MQSELSKTMIRIRAFDGRGEIIELLLTEAEFNAAQSRASGSQGSNGQTGPEWVCIEPVTGVKA